MTQRVNRSIPSPAQHSAGLVALRDRDMLRSSIHVFWAVRVARRFVVASVLVHSPRPRRLIPRVLIPSPSMQTSLSFRAATCVALILFAGGCRTEHEDVATEEPAADEVVAVESLRQRLPEAVGELTQTEVEGEVQSALGAEVAGAMARYAGDSGDRLALAVTDFGSAEMAEMMGYGWGLGAADGVERIDGHPAAVDAGPTAGEATIRVLVGERFLIESVAEGGGVDAARAGVQSLDLAALAALGGR